MCCCSTGTAAVVFWLLISLLTLCLMSVLLRNIIAFLFFFVQPPLCALLLPHARLPACLSTRKRCCFRRQRCASLPQGLQHAVRMHKMNESERMNGFTCVFIYVFSFFLPSSAFLLTACGMRTSLCYATLTLRRSVAHDRACSPCALSVSGCRLRELHAATRGTRLALINL